MTALLRFEIPNIVGLEVDEEKLAPGSVVYCPKGQGEGQVTFCPFSAL